MAEIKRHNKAEVFDTSAMPVTITLTGYEAVTLLKILESVGGHPSDSARRYLKDIHDALVSVAGLEAEMENINFKCDGEINFNKT